MRVREVLEIIQGELLSSPSISSFSGFSTTLGSLKHGELFFATSVEAIPRALEKGAYGIITTSQESPLDPEVAWFRVASLEEAALRLARYLLTSQGTHVALFNALEWEMARQILELKHALFFEGSARGLLELLRQGVPEWLFLRQDSLARLAPSILRADGGAKPPFTLFSFTLFESKIFFEGHRYTLPLPRLFLKALSSVMHFSAAQRLPFNLARLESTRAMHPCFLNARGRITKRGQSNRVVMAEVEVEPFQRYATYLKMNAKWAQILFLVPTPWVETFDFLGRVQGYSDSENLLQLIASEPFHFALILGVGLEFLEQNLQDQSPQASLFD